MVVVGILAGMMINIGTYAMHRMESQRARTEIAAMENAMEAYRLDEGFYPASTGVAGSSATVYRALTGAGKNYLNFGRIHVSGNTILDPFGSEYLYKSPGDHNPLAFDLWSIGPDRINSTADDIVNDKAN